MEALGGFETVVPVLSAVAIHLSAARLVRSELAFYIFGAFLGVIALLLLIALAWQRLIPKGLVPVPVSFGGWPLCLYLYYKAWLNFGWLLQHYPKYFIIYAGTASAISLAFCYRIGPPTDHRTLNLMKWALQLGCLLLIYSVLPNKPLASGIILTLATLSAWKILFPMVRRSWKEASQWLREMLYGPAPRKLLTEEEYREEAENYTEAELRKLKQHLSTSSDNWKTVSRLQNPKKVSSFIVGETDHVTPSEVSVHSIIWPDEDDQESEEEFISDDEDFDVPEKPVVKPVTKWGRRPKHDRRR